jgi:hypothetical protein
MEEEQMPTLVHKVQVLLTDEQHRLLLKMAKAQRKPLSVLLREGVVEQIIKETRRAAKRKACDEIAAMDLPIGEWAEMEAEITRTHAGARRRP